jgi:oligopeptide transport system substrate-binding protein
MRYGFALRSALLAALATVAFAMPADAAKVLRRGNAAEPYSLDPHRATGIPENNIIGDMIIGLYTEGPDAMPIFGAAESAQTSEDGLTWTFKIRDHLWSDGTPVTANDFVFALRREMNPATAAQYAAVLYPIKNAQKVREGGGKVSLEELGVRAPDAKTLVIELEHPTPFLPQLLTHYTAFPVPQHVIEKYASDWTKPGRMVSNGPYLLAEWRPHDHVKLVKNPKFWDAANVKIDEIYFYPTDDDQAALKRFRSNELDTQYKWPLTEHKWLAQNIPNEARTYTALNVSFISFNVKRKPLDDVRVRRALAEAVDYDAIERDVYGHVYGEVANSIIPPGTSNVERTAQVPWAGMSMEQRKADARKLLAEAGFGPKNPLHLTYSYIQNPDIKRAAVAMQAMWREVGADIDISATEFKVHYKLLEAHDFDMAITSWQLDYDDAQNILYLFQTSTVEMNYPNYSNPVFDKMMAQAEAEKDVKARAKILGQAAAVVMNDVPFSPTFYPYVRPIVRSTVLGWVNNPRDINRTRWLDIETKPGPQDKVAGTSGTATASEGGFWSWLGSWFSPEAWSKWWNS